MDSDDYGFTQNCICGRTFTQHNAYNYHRRNCKSGKKRLSEALTTAKEHWKRRKTRELPVGGDGMPSLQGCLDPPQDMASVDQSVDEGAGTQAGYFMPQPTLPEATENAQSKHLDVDGNLSLAERRHRRSIILPKRFRDILPAPLPALPPASVEPLDLPNPPSIASPSSSNNSLTSRMRRVFQTPRNVFGLFRRYCSDRPPSHDPEENVELSDLFDHPTAAGSALQPLNNAKKFYPFPNESSFLLSEWYWNGGVQKSQESFHKLLDIVGHPDFLPEDVRGTKWRKIDGILAKNEFDGTNSRSKMNNVKDDDGDAEWIDEDAGWKRTPISISVPFHSRLKNPGPKKYFAGDLYHRSFVSVIRDKLTNPKDDRRFHYEPFELYWKPTDESADVQIHGELYSSPAFLEAHRALQDSPGEPGCELPRAVVAMMFWSDGTHLTSFGNAKLVPCYLFFGNESKYDRCKPTCHLCNHVAYFQTLPDAFKDFITQHTDGKAPSKELMTHCRRELAHAQWNILLDDEFIEAYKHGIIIECCDGIKRRFYPRILTYSADYPEKVLLASIRDKGVCPCPRCLIPLSRVQNMGMKRDMKQRETLARVDDKSRRRKVATARDIIYNKNYAVNTSNVEALLMPQSLVPTTNAFSEKLSPFGFNLFAIFVVDLMHEFELGIWRDLFIHLLRTLRAANKDSIHELDRRYRQVSTFGADVIRKFSNNVSALRKLAARDFEDLLQCAIPVFEGLLPEPHNSSILRLLFVCAHWHSLAKLRMHTDQTLKILDDATINMGAELRAFNNKTCNAFVTQELPRETAARKRRGQKKTKRKQSSPDDTSGPSADPSVNAMGEPDGPLPKRFNLRKYKYHSLGDYAKMIRRLGTSDSFSTEPGELEHRTAKARYKRTDKKHFVRQLAQIERREARLRRIRTRFSAERQIQSEVVGSAPQEHHHIGVSQNHFEHIGTFLRHHAGDPAIHDFLPKLKQHILPRVLSKLQLEEQYNTQAQGLGDDAGPHPILFSKDRLYLHNIMRINYTGYDVRRSQDVINPSTSHCNIMVLAGPNDGGNLASYHPFRYARVIGIYHVNAVYVGPGMVDYQPHRMEVLWVRWYCTVDGNHSGWAARKLDCVQFASMTDDDAFGFIDPHDVLRSSHIVPAFARGKIHADEKGLSRCARDSSDWVRYYINRFVDRDMMMRYHYGLGVGHTYSFGIGEQVANQTRDCGPILGDEDDEGVESLVPDSHGVLAEPDSEDSSIYLGSGADDSEDGTTYDESDESDDEERLQLNDMYGFR